MKYILLWFICLAIILKITQEGWKRAFLMLITSLVICGFALNEIIF